MPADTLRQNMIPYVGNGAGNTDGDVNWVAANDSAAYIYTQTTPQNEYIYVGDSLNWINCDAVFPGNGTYYSITANPVNCPNVIQTQMFVLVNNQHAIWRLSYTGSQFQTPQDIVSGVPVTIVAVCTSGGKVYSAFTPVTASSNQTVNMNFAVTTDTLFRTQLRAIH